MSDLHVDLVRQEMEENGELDFIRQHVEAANLNEVSAPAPAAPAADTVEVPAVEEGEPVDTQAAVAVTAAPEGTGELTAEEEDTLYLELDDATQALIDAKYGGDINKALQALPDAQSVIGRQGNELGALRKQLEDFQAEIRQTVVQSQPYPDWPEEFDDPGDAAARFREISETAFARGDVATFQNALAGWETVDRVSVANYRDLKEMQIAAQMAQQQAPVPAQAADEDILLQGVEAIRTKYPQFQDVAFQAQVAAELDKTPSLKAVLWEGVPGVSPQERLAVLEEAAQRVLARTTSETVAQARKRIAIRTSEEARAARAEAQAARGATARETGGEPEKRTIPLGTTGKSLDIDRLNAMLPEGDRL